MTVMPGRVFVSHDFLSSLISRLLDWMVSEVKCDMCTSMHINGLMEVDDVDTMVSSPTVFDDGSFLIWGYSVLLETGVFALTMLSLRFQATDDGACSDASPLVKMLFMQGKLVSDGLNNNLFTAIAI